MVTVVIPTYNAEQFIDHVLGSILQQSYPNFECLIVNDFSTDSSEKIARKYAQKDKRFHLVNHRANGGLAAARNTGIRLANGDFICFLDSDDFFLVDSLKNRLNAILAYNFPEVVGSYGGSISVKEDDFSIPHPKKINQTKIIDFISAGGNCPFNANQPMLKTSVVRKLGGFNEHLRQAEDWDFWSRILRHGYCFVPSPYTDVAYRSRRGSMVRRGPLEHLKTSYAIYRLNHEPLPEEQIFDGVPFVFRKPWIEYKMQMDFCDRFFQFAGMNQSRTFEEEEIGNLFEAFIPDYVDVIAKHRDGGKKALHGVFRQYSITNLEQPFQSYFTSSTIAKVFKQAGRLVGNQPYRHFAEVAWQPFPPIEPQKQKEIDVVFMPHSKYHVWTMYCVTPYLDEQGIKYIFVDSTVPYRDQGVRQGIEERNLPSVSYNNFVLGSFEPKIMVCMDDWDTVVKPAIEAAKEAGIPTVGLVEGVQDFWDVDTGRVRKPYRTVEYVFLPGKFDQRYFADCIDKTRVVGIPRIDELLLEVPKFPEKPLVVVNVNFTYNVLEECREEWLKGVVEACKIAGVKYVISQHPADKADLSNYNVSDKSMYDLIRQGSIFVSRFSSGILEALAMGKPAIYHNPHGEKVDKFWEPMGAYPVTDNLESLAQFIHKLIIEVPSRIDFNSFLEFHCEISKSKSSSEKVADEICNIMTLPNRKKSYVSLFKTFFARSK